MAEKNIPNKINYTPVNWIENETPVSAENLGTMDVGVKNVTDAYNVESEYLIGKVVASSVIVGKISRLVANPLIFIPIILIPLALILISNLVGTIHMAKKIAKEEEEEERREAIRKIKEKQQ